MGGDCQTKDRVPEEAGFQPFQSCSHHHPPPQLSLATQSHRNTYIINVQWWLCAEPKTGRYLTQRTVQREWLRWKYWYWHHHVIILQRDLYRGLPPSRKAMLADYHCWRQPLLCCRTMRVSMLINKKEIVHFWTKCLLIKPHSILARAKLHKALDSLTWVVTIFCGTEVLLVVTL